VLEAPTGREGLIAGWWDASDLVLFDPALTDISARDFSPKLCDNPRTSAPPLVAPSGDLRSPIQLLFISKRPLQIW
jgi:hypothetical protein